MTEVTFQVSPGVAAPIPLPVVDHGKILRQAFRRPIEALWKPTNSLVSCTEDHALLTAVHNAFFLHHPLRLSPDMIWLTLARGFALHVNLHAEELRHRFVSHSGKEKLVVERRDFFPGHDNPWAEVFEVFSEQIRDRVGRLRDFVVCDFSTTGPIERAVSELMVMETFQAYFDFEFVCGCGIPEITLAGNVDDWKSIRNRAALFGEFGLQRWAKALDPVLAQFVAAAEGKADQSFWQSFFRYRSGSGPSVMTGWITTLFPYLTSGRDNFYIDDWARRLEIDVKQDLLDQWDAPQGVRLNEIPSCLTSVPMRVHWGNEVAEMRLIGGLIGVSQNAEKLVLQPECGWVIVYEEPVDELSENYALLEEMKKRISEFDE